MKETPLSLAPLTVFAGPNSSGKSSILQSLLLVSQTLSHKVSSRSVVLNGTLTRLGQFDDLKSHDSESDQITIGWECHPVKDGQQTIIEGGQSNIPITVFGRRIDSIKEISCKLAFDANPGNPDSDLFQLQPQLFLFNMSVLSRAEDNTDKRYDVTVSRSHLGSAKAGQLIIDERDNELMRASLEYDIVIDDNSLSELREDFTTVKPVGCVLRHFLPERISIRINIIEEIAKFLFLILNDDIPRYFRGALFTKRELIIPEKVLIYLKDTLDDKFDSLFDMQQTLFEIQPGMPFQEWIDRTRHLQPAKKRELRHAIADCEDLQKIIIEALHSEWKTGEPEHKLLPHRLPIGLLNASGYLGLLFSNSLKYLGPLRDEPKPLYPLTAHADPTDVGLCGEMTAAVLNLHKERRIRFIPSSSFIKTPFEPAPIVRSLESAVTDWLKYLGVAETVRSVDKGKLGHEIKVSLTERGPDHDLTHVGVGVSQVLPILIMSLLSNQDTTLIFEQPEIHLHPKVQTRLADFFLSIVLMGKQCLIETHSEYLINRLRYRAATEGEINRVTSQLKVYFVEKDSSESTFREVKVNEYGAILDWPKGFFDQGQREAEAILRAATAKRKSKREK